MQHDTLNTMWAIKEVVGTPSQFTSSNCLISVFISACFATESLYFTRTFDFMVNTSAPSSLTLSDCFHLQKAPTSLPLYCCGYHFFYPNVLNSIIVFLGQTTVTMFPVVEVQGISVALSIALLHTDKSNLLPLLHTIYDSYWERLCMLTKSLGKLL